MEMTVDLAFMLIVGVLRAKDCGTNGASKMLNVIFSIQGRYI